MTLKPWLTKAISIHLIDKNTGFISTVRYGKIHLKPEVVRTEKITESLPTAPDRELRKPKSESYEG
jgi:hypothetical protein